MLSAIFEIVTGLLPQGGRWLWPSLALLVIAVGVLVGIALLEAP